MPVITKDLALIRRFMLSIYLIASILLFSSVLPGTFAQTPGLDEFDQSGATLLINAAMDGTVEEINALLKKGASVDIKDSHGRTALMYASLASPRIPNIISTALAHGTTNTPIKPELYVESIKALLKAGANVNAADKKGLTSLMFASFRGYDEYVKVLIKNGADVNLVDSKGFSALSYSKARDFEGTSILLTKAGANGKTIPPTEIPKHLSPIDILPKLLNKADVKPEYNDKARQAGVQGVVRFRVLIGADGKLKKGFLVSGLPNGLTEASQKALFQLKAEAGMDGGKNVEYWIPLQYSFVLY